MSLCVQTLSTDRSRLRTINHSPEFLPIIYTTTLFPQADTSLFRSPYTDFAPRSDLMTHNADSALPGDVTVRHNQSERSILHHTRSFCKASSPVNHRIACLYCQIIKLVFLFGQLFSIDNLNDIFNVICCPWTCLIYLMFYGWYRHGILLYCILCTAERSTNTYIILYYILAINTLTCHNMF